MFGKKPVPPAMTDPAYRAHAARAADPAKPAMIQGGAAMMLKSMGVDPAQMEQVAEAFLKDVGDMAERVEKIEARLSALDARLTIVLAALERIEAAQQIASHE